MKVWGDIRLIEATPLIWFLILTCCYLPKPENPWNPAQEKCILLKIPLLSQRGEQF
jgi:hypothetical protein